MGQTADIVAPCDKIRCVSLALHKHLRHGHAEKVNFGAPRLQINKYVLSLAP